MVSSRKEFGVAISDVQDVVEIRSNVISACRLCKAGFSFTDSDVDERVTHYITQHGYKVLHIGQETTENLEGKLWECTVAILGK
jgi:hypothetical protein